MSCPPTWKHLIWMKWVTKISVNNFSREFSSSWKWGVESVMPGLRYQLWSSPSALWLATVPKAVQCLSLTHWVCDFGVSERGARELLVLGALVFSSSVIHSSWALWKLLYWNIPLTVLFLTLILEREKAR